MVAEDQRIQLEAQLRLRGMTVPPANAAAGPAAPLAPDVVNFLKKQGMTNALIGATEATEEDGNIPEEVVNAADSLADFRAEQDRPLEMNVKLFLANGEEQERVVTVRNADGIAASLGKALGFEGRLIAKAAGGEECPALDLNSTWQASFQASNTSSQILNLEC